MPPVTLDRYNHAQLESQFAERIASDARLENVAVRIASSRLADLDADGAADDLYGTARLQVGNRFKSFIYLLREDGAVRFLENSGASLDPESGLTSLMCTESRAWLCRPNLERATRSVATARIAMLEYDAATRGLELVIHHRSGNLTVLNSLALFASP